MSPFMIKLLSFGKMPGMIGGMCNNFFSNEINI